MTARVAMVPMNPKMSAGCSSRPTSRIAAMPGSCWKAGGRGGGGGPGVPHRVHDPGGRVGASQAAADGTVDDGDEDEPPAHAPQRVAEQVVGVGVRGEGAHVAGPPPARAAVGREAGEYR